MFRICVSAGRRGFSLVELVIVVALIAMMSLLAAPWFIKLNQRNQIKSAARELQTTLLAARMKAVKRNQQVNVVISSVTPPLEFQTIEPVPPAPTPTPQPSILRLPPSAAQFVATPNSAGGTVTFGGDGRVVNFAATPAIYQVQGPVGSTRMNMIEIRAHASGRIEVVTPTVWQ
ncbi:MAG TPA: GspH/FimT family pseudopilin [Thermoanaerobaculia bacterium]|nr:GspH/FimT family pseudopilin [Thermoanaerobaculia bacterium]